MMLVARWTVTSTLGSGRPVPLSVTAPTTSPDAGGMAISVTPFAAATVTASETAYSAACAGTDITAAANTSRTDCTHTRRVWHDARNLRSTENTERSSSAGD